jgi:hypothetical protein
LEFSFGEKMGDGEDGCGGMKREKYPSKIGLEKKIQTQDPGTKQRNPGHPSSPLPRELLR